jgi:uncharacterized protein
MMIVKNYVAASEIHGVGLFAGEDIEKDQLIYILDPKVDLVMDAKQIDSIGEEFARFMGIYAFTELNTREVMISLDNSRFMNHCEFPNTLWTYVYGWAARDIRKGEELTCDYYSFWHEPPIRRRS